MNKSEFLSKHDPSDEVRHLRAEVTNLQSVVNERRKTSGQVAEAMSSVLKAVHVAHPPKQVYTGQKSKTKVQSPVTHVVHLTDWHIGQVTDPARIEEFGEFDYSVACQRVGALGHAITAKTDVMRSGYTVDECHVMHTGDHISGGIHPELLSTNEFPEPVQAVKSGYLLGSFLLGLSQHFKKVTADLLTTGNHDRITKKPQCEEGGLNSWGYVTCEIAKQFCSSVKNIHVNVHTAMSKVIPVAGQQYLVYHGHRIKGHYGIPFYGIERKKQMEAMARMNMSVDKHFDRIVIGHFHTSLNHMHWIVGGSLTGTTALDHEEGRHAEAHQTSWFVHPRHGEFDWSRWFLRKPRS